MTRPERVLIAVSFALGAALAVGLGFKRPELLSGLLGPESRDRAGTLASADVAGAARGPTEKDRQCPVQLGGFDQVIQWKGDARGRARIQAQSACGRSFNGVIEMSRVTLTLERDGKRLARIESPRGVLAQGSRRFALGETTGPMEAGVVPPSPLVSLDLDSGRVRAPGGFDLDLNPDPKPAPRATASSGRNLTSPPVAPRSP